MVDPAGRVPKANLLFYAGFFYNEIAGMELEPVEQETCS